MKTTRKVEIFSAGCPVCNDAVDMVKRISMFEGQQMDREGSAAGAQFQDMVADIQGILRDGPGQIAIHQEILPTPFYRTNAVFSQKGMLAFAQENLRAANLPNNRQKDSVVFRATASGSMSRISATLSKVRGKYDGSFRFPR